MNGPDGKPMHAELTLRATTLMLGPESPAMGRRTAKSVGASPASLNIYVENVDKVVEKATKLGATPQGPVMDMFWGDRCGTVLDPDGYNWMVGTHKAEPSAKEMKKGMEEMMKQQPPAAAAELSDSSDLNQLVRQEVFIAGLLHERHNRFEPLPLFPPAQPHFRARQSILDEPERREVR